MKRVMIVGGPGSGKSTLARALGRRTGLPVFHMDHIHWQSGWVQTSDEDRDRLTHEIHMKDCWIFEGGHSRTYDERISRADTFVWLDIPVGWRLWRVIKRLVKSYGQSRPDLPDGCPEKFRWRTIEFLNFIVRTRKKSRARLETLCQTTRPHVSVFRLKSLKEANAFVASLSSGTGSENAT